MPIRERFPNNWWGWAKLVGSAAFAGLVGFSTGGPLGAVVGIGLNLQGLLTHTPANTALTPMQLQARAAEQAVKQGAL